MGSSSSKIKFPPQGQYPGFPAQPYGYMPPAPGYPYPPQPMGQQFYPQGFMPVEPRRKKRRRRSDSDAYPGGYAPSGTYQQTRDMQPVSEAAFHRPGANQPTAPSNTFAVGAAASNAAPRRQVHTPYPSRIPSLAAESEMAAPPIRAAAGHPANAPLGPPGAGPDVSRVLQPMTPANPAVYGPTDRHHMPRSPLSNPLPPPPRDLYELSPYNALLNLPQTTALLTASYSNQLTIGNGVKRSKTGLFGGSGGKKSGGLFRSFSSSRKPGNSIPDVKFVPVFVDRSQRQATSAAAGPSTVAAAPVSQAPPQPWSGGSLGQQPPAPQAPGQTNYPPQPSGSQMPIAPPITFSQSTPQHYGFLNHAPFRVMYQNITYPSATHLYEALKYIPDSTGPAPQGWNPRPDLANQICMTRNANEVYALSATFRQHERPDWGLVFLRVMEEVLYTKFKQHPNLRTLLMETAPAELIYQDPDDLFWSDGRRPDDPADGFPGPGENQLGKALVRVRERLRAERFA